MKNADMPVYPVERKENALGLTKREHLAALAMQSLLTNGKNEHVDDKALAAVGYADALLAALEE